MPIDLLTLTSNVVVGSIITCLSCVDIAVNNINVRLLIN